ncbi:aldo-keto reductase family 1 member B1-like isoform X1 [Styela clava]
MSQKFVRLNTGHNMPLAAFGTWNIGSMDVGPAIKQAIEVGYRHIDTSWMYGNEKEIGSTLQELYDESKLRRKDLFITSKLSQYFHDKQEVRNGLMESLKDLQTDYLDLFLMHNPCAYEKGEVPKPGQLDFVHNNEVHYLDTWKEMEKLQKEGLVRSIGVSNCNEYQINKVINESSTIPAVHQTESYPYLTEESHAQFCSKNGIEMEAYAVLGSPGRFWAPKDDEDVLADKVLRDIASKYERTTAQIAIRFQIQRGVGAVAKSANPDRIRTNFKVFDFTLSVEDMNAIYTLNKNLRRFAMEWNKGHKYWAHQENYTED